MQIDGPIVLVRLIDGEQTVAAVARLLEIQRCVVAAGFGSRATGGIRCGVVLKPQIVIDFDRHGLAAGFQPQPQELKPRT